ncbi:MAG: AMP-dependent synthetase [Desulfuromonadales bacterium GWC2_61_20]|nr:MAG: AMP-dependent synthetase [Desulfuromonadales bacterium GWC2_61_20]
MEFYDDLEQREPALRESAQMRQLAATVRQARSASPYYRELFAAASPIVGDRRTLAQLPLTRKSELGALQQRSLPFGGMAQLAPPLLSHIFVSPGPLYEPGLAGVDRWRFARALFAAGMRPGMLVHNTFAYHFTPAGRMFEAAACALGCAVIPAGPGQVEQQVRTIAELRPQGYVGTPSFLKLILDKGDELGADLDSLRCALVTGEAFPASLRAIFAARGVAVQQCYGTAEAGLIAYESSGGEGLMLDEGMVVEIVRPGTGDPLPDGEVGEVVVTLLDPTYPLIRLATGDLSALLAGTSPCGRTAPRLRGWLGRADQSTKVRGMFVHPAQVATIVARTPEILRARLVVERCDDQDVLTIEAETEVADATLSDVLTATVREVAGLRAAVRFAPPGALPNDGKVIDDRRPLP